MTSALRINPRLPPFSVAGIARSGSARAGRAGRAAALAVQIALLDADSPLHSAGQLVVSETRLNSTGVVVVTLGAAGQAPSVVVKLPMNAKAAARLELETATLSALHGDIRLGRWRELIPRPYAAGTFRGQSYRAEPVLAGRSAAGLLTAYEPPHELLQSAAEVIVRLHEATAMTARGGLAVVRDWVEVHLHELMPYVNRDRGLRLVLARVGEELCEALERGSWSASRIHGDYWLGNVLLSTSGSRPGAVAGIVDWDASSPCELPLHDLLHLVIYTRRLLTGRELGQIICEQLRGGGWSTEERLLLDRPGGSADDGSLSERQALLLYWLRHAAMHARQQVAPSGWRFKLWHRRNVRRVLESL